MGSMPLDEIGQISRKFAGANPGREGAVINHSNTLKYLDVQEWIPDSVRRAKRTQIDGEEPLRIIDLGCGAGYYLYVARAFGHSVMGLDLADNPMYDDLLQAFEIERIDHCIEPFQALPESIDEYDLITAFMVWFNWTGSEDGWGVDEWVFFLNDCVSRLTDKGKIWIELNAGRKQDQFKYLTDEQAEAIRGLDGFQLSESKKVICFGYSRQAIDGL